MAHFCNKCGADEYICQECGIIKCSKDHPSTWITVKRTGREGNVCPTCVDKHAYTLRQILAMLNTQDFNNFYEGTFADYIEGVEDAPQTDEIIGRLRRLLGRHKVSA